MQSAAEEGLTDTYYDYICVVDFEATCEVDNPSDFHHEIIEFPMVLINTNTLEIVSEDFEVRLWRSSASDCISKRVFPFLWQVDSFQEYVKPELNPQLSDFCVKLTGITQVGQAQVIGVVVFGRLLQPLWFCWAEDGRRGWAVSSRSWASCRLAPGEGTGNEI